MSNSVSLMANDSVRGQQKSYLVNSLPDPPVGDKGCSLRTKQRIDLLLLALEALELGASEKMLAAAQEMGIQDIIKHRVGLWSLRRTNPWRRSHARRLLKLEEAKALVALAGMRSRELTVDIRKLLLAEQKLREKGLPIESEFHLSEYLERFRAHFRSRMNPRRARVAVYNANDEDLNELALSLLSQLLFCTGTAGLQRLWISLFDGEVA
ncbi:MAG: DUF3038 domain-containing protein [Spirulinaceae cyanobacterium]